MSYKATEKNKSNKTALKALTIISVAFLFTILLSSIILASTGWNFISYQPTQVALSEPNFIKASLYPPKIKERDVLTFTVELQDIAGISSVEAEIEHEIGFDTEKLYLIKGNRQHGTYKGDWIAHHIINQKWYNLTIKATNMLNHVSETKLTFQDPVQNHTADEVTAGTFDTGDFAFPGNLNVTDRLNASSGSFFGPLNTTGGINTSLIYTSGSNIGIGTTTPNEKLTVEGAISLDMISAPANNTGYGKIYYNISGSLIFQFENGSVVILAGG